MIFALRRRAMRALHDIGGWPKTLKTALAILAVLALIMSLAEGGPWAVAACVVAFAVIFVAIALVAEPGDQRFLPFVGLCAILARLAVTSAFDFLQVARTGTHVFAPDEGLYLKVAGSIVANWRDPSVYIDNADGFVQMQYIRLVAAILYLIGDQVLVIKLMNTTLAVLAAVLAYRTMVNLGMPGRRVTFVLLLVFPSIALWSSLALKDAYIWFFEMAVVWSSSEYIRSRNSWWHLVTLFMLLPIESVRRYIFVTMAIAWLFVVLAVHGRERVRAAAVISSTLFFILAIIQPLKDLGVNVFYTPIAIREAGAIGGRTSFVEPLPVVRGNPGDRFVIRATNSTAQPGVTPREVVVQPGDCVVFQGATSPSNCRPVEVRPGDIAVFAGTAAAGPTPQEKATSPTPQASATAPAPTMTPQELVLNPDAKNTVSEKYPPETDVTSVGGSLAANLRHLPIGLAYVLAAPFPWTARTLSDLATIPEVLLWYVSLTLAIVGLARLVMSRDLRFAHGVAAICGLAIVFALIESNVGTLIRSRDMMILFALLLTGVGFDYVARRWPTLVPSRMRSAMLGGATAS